LVEAALSICMSHAIEVRGLAKRFTVGIGSCLAAAHVLRDIDLVVSPGEVIAIVGSSGAGKSTLLLCLAGLLTPERGEVRWFGEASRAFAAQRVLYHVARTDLMRAGGCTETKVHLVDATARMEGGDFDRWIHARRDEGHAVLLASRDESRLRPIASRILALRRGMLHETGPRPLIRVAETARHS
jgi:ABC-type glutathione transport system ATPase component